MKMKKLLGFCLMLTFIWIFFPYFTVADPLDNWYLRNNLSYDTLESVVYGNGLFVGAGGNDVWTSSDGAIWTKQTSGTNNSLYQVAYGNSIFVAVGSSGTIITSPNGITWTPQISRTTNTLRGVAFGNGFFMAVGYNATVVTSPDGTTWTLKTPNTTKSLTKLRYLNNLFVTIDYWSATILNSSDGTSWNEPDIAQADWVPDDIAYGSGTYVVVGGYGEIFTSPNLITWTERTSPGVTANSLHSVTHINGLFAAVGSSGTIITSPDGIIWTVRPSPTSSSLNDVTFGNSTFVAVGSDTIQSDPIIVETVSTPDTPNGPAGGVRSENYTYSTGGSLSSFGHSIEYQFDWKGDDSDLSAWGSPTQSKTWNVVGVYNVRVRARCSLHPSVLSNWSVFLHVNIFNHSDIQNLVTDYYNDILDRGPEPGGAEWWTAEIERIIPLGIDVKEGFQGLAKSFFNSTEYQLMGKDDIAFVTDLYQTFLNRVPDPGGLSFWVDYRNQGLTWNMLITQFAYSEEFMLYMQSLFGSGATRPENNLVNDLYRGFLNRFPDTGGFNGWLDMMWNAQCTGAQAVRDLTYQIALAFVQSAEYALRNRNNQEYVEDLYNGILRRGADAAGFLNWVALLNNGTYNREKLLQFFTDSPEFQLRVQEVINAGCMP